VRQSFTKTASVFICLPKDAKAKLKAKVSFPTQERVIYRQSKAWKLKNPPFFALTRQVIEFYNSEKLYFLKDFLC
jgi:hypothetical protein